MFRRKNTSVTNIESTLTNNKKDENIFRSLKIFLLINKLLMVAPYSVGVSQTSNKKFKIVNNYDVIYHIRCIFVICICCYGLTHYINMAARLKVVQAFLNTISIAFLLPIIFLTRRNFIEMLKKMSELETKLTNYGIACNYDKLFRLSMFQLISILLISIVSQALVSPEFILLRKILLFTLFVLPNILTMLFLCQYINIVMVLGDWLENLNEYLKELLIIEFEAVNRLHNATQIFHWLWELAQLIENAYQLPVLIVLGTTFINTAAFVYLWIIVAKINPSTYLWFFSNILKISLLPLMCEICRKKVSYYSYLAIGLVLQ